MTQHTADAAHVVYMVLRATSVKPYYIGRTLIGAPIVLDRAQQSDVIYVCNVWPTMEQATQHVAQLMQHHGLTSNDRYNRSAVQCLTTAAEYPSAAAACKALGIPRASMSLHLNNPGRYPTVNGYTFKRV